MSITSDVYITKEEAKKRVKAILLSQQEYLIDIAVRNMDNFELSGYLNGGDDLYYYNIESEDLDEEE